MKLQHILLASLIVLGGGCSNEMIAKMGGTPFPEKSKHMEVLMCGTTFYMSSQKIIGDITIELKDNAPKPLFLVVTFETPDGNKIVQHKVTDQEYT